MMNISTRRAFRWCTYAVTVFFFVAVGSVALAEDLKLEAQLVWGTNDKKAPNPRVKPVEPEIRKKLAELPLRWTNYFEINRKQFEVPHGRTGKTALSEKCSLEVKSVEDKKVEVLWYNKKGELVGRQTQPLPQGELLVLGGNAPNSTCWLLTLKRLE